MMDKESIIKILNDKILESADTVTIGSIVRQNNRYGEEKLTNKYDSLTIKEFLEYYRIDILEEQGVVTEELANTLRDMLGSYIDVRRIFEADEVPMFAEQAEYNKKREELIAMSDFIKKELDGYSILIENDKNIIEDLFTAKVKKENSGKIKKLTQGPRKG